MNEFKIKVHGARPPKKPFARIARIFRVARMVVHAVLKRQRALVLAGLTGFVLFAGTPHVGWDYGCGHRMSGPGTCRIMTYCGYYGVQGRRVHIPGRDEHCGIFKVLPIDWRKIIQGGSS